VEQAPTNLREHVMLLSRPGTTPIQTFAANAAIGLKCPCAATTSSAACSTTPVRGLWRTSTAPPDGTVTHITGVISGTGHPEVTWQKGIGYERLWIADGLLLQFYGGTTAASGVLTKTGAITSGSDKFQIGGVYYAWNSERRTPARRPGRAAQPLARQPGHRPHGQPRQGDHGQRRAWDRLFQRPSARQHPGHARPGQADPGHVVASRVTAARRALAATPSPPRWSAAPHVSLGRTTLQNGGIDALQGVAVPDGVGIRSLTEVSGYVLASVADSQKVFFVQPGAVVIDPLDFFEKESSPTTSCHAHRGRPGAHHRRGVSTENWYATGDPRPVRPDRGPRLPARRHRRHPCIVGDSVMVVGDDGVAYEIGYRPGSTAEWGVHRISNHGIEERIRRQIRREARTDAMTTLFMDPFVQYGTGTAAQANMLAGPYASMGANSGATAIVAAPWDASGALALRSSGSFGGADGPRRVLPTTKTKLITSMRYGVDILPFFNATHQIFQWRNNGNVAIATLCLDTTGSISLYNGSGTRLVGTNGPVMVPQNYQHLEFELDLDTNSFTLRVDDATGTGTPAISASGLSLSGGPIAQFTNSAQASAETSSGYTRDLILRDTAGSVNNGFNGDERVAALFAIADTATAGWTPRYYQKFGPGILDVTNPAGACVYAAAAASTDLGAADFTIEGFFRWQGLPGGSNYSHHAVQVGHR
jgi:hypothetical protein